MSDDGALLDAIGREAQALERRPTVAGAEGARRRADARAALAFAEALAPEHLELIGDGRRGARAARAHGGLRVRRRGGAATAFGDYVAGSNHTLPTGGAARFASGLSPRHFRRRDDRGADRRRRRPRSRRRASPIAEAEGFAVHAESMAARIRQNAAP